MGVGLAGRHEGDKRADAGETDGRRVADERETSGRRARDERQNERQTAFVVLRKIIGLGLLWYIGKH